MSDKKRLDAFIFERGLSESREKAKAYIMAGLVYVNGMKAVKAGALVGETDEIEVRAVSEFVSRGGYKLKKAVESFSLSLDGKICMDIGASTGGFTDCMLQNGAKRVYSVDVGYGQLAWKLRTDERVINLERTNVRYITSEQIPEPLDFFSVDVSFISLSKVLPAAYPLLKDGGECVCLIKPQFEAGRDKVGKNGVVRDRNVHRLVIEKICELTLGMGFCIKGLDFSPIKGPQGNIEYLIYLKKCSDGSNEYDIASLVDKSHENLDVGR